ncbi:ankyrin repeat protein [Arthroderma uncinatum]|uniref:ankyrin repeat protein n=1 Tax=Arthroderma uncinatum TaxID=74035 RepID=UPI00144A563D|nr:ankyrin repeat protein [Arthroderma uncinatum]KAF3482235.1 ankyrin repeat protein [Arthroderma uncinatum]
MSSIPPLPPVPAKHSGLLSYIKSNRDTPVGELLKPYNEYDSVLRQIFAQEPTNALLADNHVNLVPLYDGDGTADLLVQARDLRSEPKEVSDKYILSLKDEDRKPNGSPAIVTTFKEFQTNFNLFSESSLSDLDWSNVVAAGSSVVSALLPVPEEYNESKRQLRHFYHQKFAPASDVDLFIYGLNEEQAIEKIKQMEQKIKDSILYETTSVRTKNTITIVSQYPTRHVQIVLRIYKSIAEIVTGFDVDCACVAYDGHNVYAAPRAVAALMTQANRIDLTRRSPSYENRLSKYSHRGFEVFWPELDRSRIDPTIFERSFMKTVGLARLLVLERLPTPSDREMYMEQRRLERGRPPLITNSRRNMRKLRGNIKNDWEDEVADWVDEEEISDYHTITIPYGEKFHARKIEKLLYTHDLLLNAEWNNQKRDVNLHRHPVFFGDVKDIIQDCCGSCPKPTTPEEEEIWEAESKIYISGEISFIKDDPGRQAIGSFNPITETDWTEMAYIGNTTRLFQAIVDNDLETVREWLAQEDADPYRRDHTGRTPLHLATMVSTPEIVQCLVDNGSRLIARLADGRMALHLAAARGNVEIIRILLNKSAENEEAEEAKKDQLRKDAKNPQDSVNNVKDIDMEGADDLEIVSENAEDSDDKMSFVTGSFVDVKKDDAEQVEEDNVPDDDKASEPDIIDINAIAWDSQASPLHIAIIHNHPDVVKELVSSYGADVLLPIKLKELHRGLRAILPLTLPLRLPLEKAINMTEVLLNLGATPAQAEITGKTPLHYFAASPYPELFDTLAKHDSPAVKRAIDHVTVDGISYNPIAETALTVAVKAKNTTTITKLLDLGASVNIEFGNYMKSALLRWDSLKNSDSKQNLAQFQGNVSQPVVIAILTDQPLVAIHLLGRGADPNTLSASGYSLLNTKYCYGNKEGESLLDLVAIKTWQLRDYKESSGAEPPLPLECDESYLSPYKEGTYQMRVAKARLEEENTRFKKEQESYESKIKEAENLKGLEEKKCAVEALLHDFKALESALVAKGAKTFKELYPDVDGSEYMHRWRTNNPWKREPFKIEFIFNAPDLSDEKQKGYIKLFEAAWLGDLETIKLLTLEMWGPNKDMSPLSAAVSDSTGASPFSLAVLRGHLDVAKAILQIVRAQYKPEVPAQKTFRMDSDNESDYSDNDPDNDDVSCEGELAITGEKICDEFTIDNIGETATKAESNVSPLQVLQKPCKIGLLLDHEDCKVNVWSNPDLFDHAIVNDNIDLLRFLLDLGQSEVISGVENGSYTLLSDHHLDKAIQCGQPRFLAEIISRTGAGLPLNKFVEESGIVLKNKSRYYQGLSIHGKKREDWAAAAGQEAPTAAQDKSAPLLLRAAVYGNLSAVEWLLSTAPKRHYMDYANSNKQDKRLRKLAQIDNGIEGSIQKWLNLRNDLLLHCAILSRENDESTRLVKYIVDNLPNCLETKSPKGYTPLLLAFSKQRCRFAKILIDAGANQEARDIKGNNILHILLRPNGGKLYPMELEPIKTLLDFLDPRLLSSLLTARSSDEPGALTPFASWIHSLTAGGQGLVGDEKLKVTKLLLDFAEPTGQTHLELLDGAGNTPIHNAVRCQQTYLLKLMLERRPDLLTRENSTGSTPMELARDAWATKATSDPPKLPTFTMADRYYSSHNLLYTPAILAEKPEFFVLGKTKKGRGRASIYKTCLSFVPTEETNRKRKLVSLFEANDVAKRVDTRVKPRFRRRLDNNIEGDDEVSKWYDWHR